MQNQQYKAMRITLKCNGYTGPKTISDAPMIKRENVTRIQRDKN